MRTLTIHRSIWTKTKVIVLAFLVAATMGVTAAPAPAATTAVPSSCSHGIRPVSIGQGYYAYAVCRSGSGYYRVGFGCKYFSGEEYWVWGPTRRVGEGESRGQCHAHTRPTVTSVQTWT